MAAPFTGPLPTRNNQRFSPKISSIPQSLSWIASAHPVHTVVLVALLVSSVYVSLLENSLVGGSRHEPETDAILSLGKPRHLYAGPESAWKWRGEKLNTPIAPNVDHRAIVALEFDQLPSGAVPSLLLPDYLSVEQLPLTPSRGHSLAFSLPHSQVFDLLRYINEIKDNAPNDIKWVRRTNRIDGRTSLVGFAQNKWAELERLFHIAAPLDILVMAVIYTSMHLTFVSLFLSMYRMGSRFWLFASVLLSSTFAFLFALFTTVKCGIAVNLALLSEGLPFLVVTIGFENSIKLTQAALSNARASGEPKTREPEPGSVLSVVQTAIGAAIKQEGPGIVRQYLAEVAVLSAGALFSVDGALRQFCFLAAWILFFDCILLFTFYAAILSIKLEIIRIQRNGRAYGLTDKDLSGITMLGQRITPTSLRKLKVGMISGFLLVNVLNMSMIPLRSITTPPSVSLMPYRVESRTPMSYSMDPFHVTSDSLDALLNEAKLSGQKTLVTVLPPIEFELDGPQSSGAPDHGDDLSRYGVGSLLKNLEDPVLFKCVIAALAISVALNGRLLAASRSGIKDTSDANSGNTISTEASDTHPAVQPIQTQSVVVSGPTRPQSECLTMLRSGRVRELTDDELVDLSLAGNLPFHALEKTLKDFTRAVKIRRSIIASRIRGTSERTHPFELSELPYEQYDWSRVFGVCCENVVGYMPLPVGFAGPLIIDGKSYFLPMATTEGVLVAGVSRGSKAINAGRGVQTVLTADGMTRGPCVSFDTLDRTAEAKRWLDSTVGQTAMKTAFNSTTRYGPLESLRTTMAGTNLYIRFKASTGDAMGMNMISKGVEHALKTMRNEGFEDMNTISLSANYCSDKKPAAINWIDGRGKSVVAQAVIPAEIVRNVLKTDVDTLVAVGVDKNLIGSAMAGSVGGFNAHAANIVAAMFLATGQDPAQVVESANCITIMKIVRGSLQISVSMPSIEVGTIGGGTTLGPQGAMLDMLGVRGANSENPGDNSRRLARIVAAATLAAELSLCAALAAGHLVQAHMQHNRAPAT